MPAQEEDDMLAFQKWKKKWDKNYATPDEDKAKFQTFKENLCTERFYFHLTPSGKSLWEVLSDWADRPFNEHLGYIRLDRHLATSDESDGDNDESHDDATFTPVKQKAGTSGCQQFVIQCDAATVKPVKRTSDATKEKDTVKRQKIGCGGQNTSMLACCSD